MATKHSVIDKSIDNPVELEEYLLIGQNVHKARIAQNMSIDALHDRTLVPRYFIRALEIGDINNFPEEVYVWHLVQALTKELDIPELKTTVPGPLHPNIVPSWYDPKADRVQDPTYFLNMFQLYVGMALVLTSTVSGMSYLLANFLENSAIAQDSQASAANHIHQNRCSEECTVQMNVAEPELSASGAVQFD